MRGGSIGAKVVFKFFNLLSSQSDKKIRFQQSENGEISVLIVVQVDNFSVPAHNTLFEQHGC